MKRLTVVLALLTGIFLLSPLVYSQPGTTSLQWIKQAGGTLSDRAVEIALDPTGTDANRNSAIIGFFQGTSSFNGITFTSAGGLDLFVVKYGGTGNVLWAKRFGGTLDDYGESIAFDNAGNIVIAGRFFSASIAFGASTLTNGSTSGNGDIFVVKFDPNGNVLWARKAGGANDDAAQSVTTDASNNVIITGRFKGTATFTGSTSTNTVSVTSAGDFDIFVAQYTSSGVLGRAIRAGGNGTDYGFDVVADESNNFYVTGDFTGTVTFGTGTSAVTLTSAGGTDIFVAKYAQDATTSLLWAKRAGGASSERGIGIGVSKNMPFRDGVIVTGTFSNTATFGTTTLTSAGNEDIFIAKYSRNGDFGNVVQAGGASTDFVTNLNVDSELTSFITGFFQNSTQFGTTTLTSAGSNDIFIAKYDRGLYFLSAQRAGGASSDLANCIVATTSGEVRLTGTFRSIANFDSPTGPIQLISQGQDDIFLARYQSPQSNGLAKPTNVVAQAISSTRMKITWTDNSDNEVYFRIQRRPRRDGSNGFDDIGRTPPNVTTFIDSTITSIPETDYTYLVSAFGRFNESSSGSDASSSIAAPSDCHAAASGSNTILIQWHDNSQKEQGYKIARSVQNVAPISISPCFIR